VLEQLRDPLRVADVGLTARHRLHVSGVEQPHLHDFFEAVERRLPIRRGRLHRRNRHTGLDQPVPHQPQRPRRGAKRPRLTGTAPSRTRRTHTHRHRRLAHIQPGDAFEHDFHPDHSFPLTTRSASPGRSSARTQTHVLAATIQRHPKTSRHTPLRAHPHQCVPTSPDDTLILIRQGSDRRSQTVTPLARPWVLISS
jgi:hypothetical protein